MDANMLRRKIVAEQIKSAMESRGISRKELAEGVGRTPSEVTRWLSGSHNFTIDLLGELSEFLGVPITGVAYGDSGILREPSAACRLDGIMLPAEAYDSLRTKAVIAGKSLNDFAKSVLIREAEKKSWRASDFCGIWEDSRTDEQIVDEIKGYRTSNRIVEL